MKTETEICEDPEVARQRDRATRVVTAVTAIGTGEVASARDALEGLWAEATGSAPMQVIVAHFLADTQEDVASELEWDLKALSASDSCRGDTLWIGETELTVESFLPSLHLNVGDALRRSGEVGRAREHADLAAAATDALPQDGYGATVRGAIERLKGRLAGGAA